MPLRHACSQRGFTLIEVLVGITILLVGVLGVVAMIDGANAVTTKTKAREGANNVARSVVEVGRAVQYKNLTDTALLGALASRPGLNDSSTGPEYTIESRGFDYDVTLQVCSMDDPKDNLGPHDGTIEFCPDSDVGSGSGSSVDRNPDDYKRIAITLSWARNGSTETVKQTSLISNPVGGLGPTVVRLVATGVGGTAPTVTTPGPVGFEAETSTDAAQLDWSVRGARQGQADPVGSSKRKFTFTWDIEGSSGGQYYSDCTYVIQAEAFDDKGRAGSPKALTVVLNRATPQAPDQLQGGRNGNADWVDLRWKANPECDVLGYRVYRSAAPDGPWTQVTCLGQVGTYITDNTCLDPGDASESHYYVVGVDTAPGGGTIRDGAPSFITVAPAGVVPAPPTNLSACLGGTAGCTEPDGTPASDGATVVRWDASPDPGILFYRIYRDGSSYAERFGVFFPNASGALAWTDPETPSGAHTYYLTAVDSNFAESVPSAPVVDFP